MQIVVAGHLCLDIIPNWETGSLDSLIPGSIVQMDGITFSTGGVVSNTGTALHRLGFAPKLIGKVGDDHIGAICRAILAGEGIDLDQMAICPGATTSYSVVLNPPDTDRVFLHYPGTNDSFSVEDIDFSKITEGLFHFGYPPLMQNMYKDNGKNLQAVFQSAKKAGLITSLDMAMPDPNSEAGKVDWQRIIETILPAVDVFLPSVDELLYMLDKDTYEKVQSGALLLNSTMLGELSDRLLAMGGTVIVIKIGDQGLYLRTSSQAGQLFGSVWGDRELISPCFKVQVKGTTGAGDSTIAGFLAGLAEGRPPEEVVTLATAVGACCVEALSATEGIPSMPEVAERIGDGWQRATLSMDHSNFTRGAHGVWRGPVDQVGKREEN